MLIVIREKATKRVLGTLDTEEGGGDLQPLEGEERLLWPISREEWGRRAPNSSLIYAESPENLWGEEDLSALKAAKRVQMEGLFHLECERDFGSPYVAMALIVQGATNDPRLVAATQRVVKLQQKYVAIEAATTPAEVEAVGW